jgi:hypothetical protein
LGVAPLNVHAQQLYTDLGRLADGGAREVGRPVAEVYNKLLQEAKKERPNDPVVSILAPVEGALKPGELLALAGQLHLALDHA